MQAAGADYLAIAADLASIAPVERILDETIGWAGRADILVNNAGIIRRADPLEFSEQDWDDVINVDLKSVFFLAQAFAKRAVARGGGAKIINVASILAQVGGIRVPSYTASKHGVAGLTKLLANEWAAKGINVNAIAPGYVRTDATQALQDDPVRSERLLSRIPGRPLGRARGHGRRGGVPRLARLGLLPRHRAGGRWRVARGVTQLSRAHSRASGNPALCKELDPRFRGDERNNGLNTSPPAFRPASPNPRASRRLRRAQRSASACCRLRA